MNESSHRELCLHHNQVTPGRAGGPVPARQHCSKPSGSHRPEGRARAHTPTSFPSSGSKSSSSSSSPSSSKSPGQREELQWVRCPLCWGPRPHPTAVSTDPSQSRPTCDCTVSTHTHKLAGVCYMMCPQMGDTTSPHLTPVPRERKVSVKQSRTQAQLASVHPPKEGQPSLEDMQTGHVVT